MRKLQEGEEIIIDISQAGDIKMKVAGIKGTGCMEVTRPFEALGMVTIDRATSEMREVEHEGADNRHQARR